MRLGQINIIMNSILSHALQIKLFSLMNIFAIMVHKNKQKTKLYLRENTLSIWFGELISYMQKETLFSR